MLVALTTMTPVHSTPPIFTRAPAWEFVPVIVTAVPPAAPPLDGEMFVTVTVTDAPSRVIITVAPGVAGSVLTATKSPSDVANATPDQPSLNVLPGSVPPSV